MKHIRRIMVLLVIVALSLTSISYAAQVNQSLEDVINSNASISKENIHSTDREHSHTSEEDKEFIEGLNKAGNLVLADIQGAEKVTEGIKYIAAWIVQVLSYALICLLVIRVILDLIYIGLPFLRVFLSNGFTGTRQLGAGGMGPGMMNGMGGLGGGMSQGMTGSMGSMGTAAGPNQPAGRVQWISNAALNAVENADSGNSPFKSYIKDMVLTLVLIPILITLAATGALNNIGFMIGEILVGLIRSLHSLI